jgi:hypothetical protein
MTNGILDEAYERLRFAGPEWGEDVLTNHGPMAVEAMVRRGHADRVHHWLDGYLKRLDDLPSASSAIGADTWREALGDGRRIGDWTVYFERAVASRPWTEVLAEWWPRLLPGIVAGATHGVIRVSHAVNALVGTGSVAGCPGVAELAHGLAFWAARWRPVPGTVPAAGGLDAATALTCVPRLRDQSGPVATRLGRLPDLPGWADALAGLRPPTTPRETQAALRDLVTAGTLMYLDHGPASPVLLVHVATAPNAVLRTLPALPTDLWARSLDAVWAASAALVCAYAPQRPQPPETRPTAPADAADLLDLAVHHGDEHVIKLSDTAADVFAWTGDADALRAAVRASTLIGGTRG